MAPKLQPCPSQPQTYTAAHPLLLACSSTTLSSWLPESIAPVPALAAPACPTWRVQLHKGAKLAGVGLLQLGRHLHLVDGCQVPVAGVLQWGIGALTQGLEVVQGA